MSCYDERTTSSNYIAIICRYCGGSCISAEACPRVSAIDYDGYRDIKRVELREVQPITATTTVWPYDVTLTLTNMRVALRGLLDIVEQTGGWRAADLHLAGFPFKAGEEAIRAAHEALGDEETT